MSNPKALVLVEKNHVRYIGMYAYNFERNVEDEIRLESEIALDKAYELSRVEIMTREMGPQVRHMLVPIGLDGARAWTICDPDGFSVIEETDPLQTAYQGSRAKDSGLTIAPAGSVPNPKGLIGV